MNSPLHLIQSNNRLRDIFESLPKEIQNQVCYLSMGKFENSNGLFYYIPPERVDGKIFEIERAFMPRNLRPKCLDCDTACFRFHAKNTVWKCPGFGDLVTDDLKLLN